MQHVFPSSSLCRMSLGLRHQLRMWIYRQYEENESLLSSNESLQLSGGYCEESWFLDGFMYDTVADDESKAQFGVSCLLQSYTHPVIWWLVLIWVLNSNRCSSYNPLNWKGLAQLALIRSDVCWFVLRELAGMTLCLMGKAQLGRILMVQKAWLCHLELVVDIQGWLCSVLMSLNQSMWCWWKCIALALKEIVCRLPANVNVSHFPPHLFFPLWQSQTAPTSSSSPQEKTLWCSRRQHRRVSQSLSQLLSHLIHPLLHLLLYLSLPLASLSRSASPFLCPLPAAVSHHLLAALFQAGHCLICECLRSVLPTLCSSVSKLPSNISFYWQTRNVKTSGIHVRVNAEVHLYKPHHLLFPHGKKGGICTCSHWLSIKNSEFPTWLIGFWRLIFWTKVFFNVSCDDRLAHFSSLWEVCDSVDDLLLVWTEFNIRHDWKVWQIHLTNKCSQPMKCFPCLPLQIWT